MDRTGILRGMSEFETPYSPSSINLAKLPVFCVLTDHFSWLILFKYRPGLRKRNRAVFGNHNLPRRMFQFAEVERTNAVYHCGSLPWFFRPSKIDNPGIWSKQIGILVHGIVAMRAKRKGRLLLY